MLDPVDGRVGVVRARDPRDAVVVAEKVIGSETVTTPSEAARSTDAMTAPAQLGSDRAAREPGGSEHNGSDSHRHAARREQM